MASHLFSRVRHLHCLRGALRHSHPNPLSTPQTATSSTPQETSLLPCLRRPAPAFPNPRLFSSSSSASVANEEAVDSDAEVRKAGNGDGSPDGDKKGLSELFRRRGTAGAGPENGRLRRSGSRPGGEKKPADHLLSKTVGLSRNSGEVEEPETVGEEALREGIDEMKKHLQALKNSKKRLPVHKPNSLTSLFAASNRKTTRWRSSSAASNLKRSPKSPKSVKNSDPMANDLFASAVASADDFSPELISFVERLIEEGHMQKANFLKDGKLEVNSLCSSYARNFVRSAAEQFAREHQEVAKWLSGSELKKVALVGCPQIDRSTAFSAKRLRSFFEIQENTVCEACQLKDLCGFKNMGVQTEENLNLVSALRVLTIYALKTAHPQLVVSEETKQSVSKLLKEVVNLSK
ncbi:unnamed protein product [Victoria cruziana]